MIKIKNYTDRAEIFIYGDIITDTDASWLKLFDDGTLGYQYPTKIKEQLDALKGLPVDVHIASDGGDVAAGIAIYNILSQHDAPVTVYIDSWAASIASVIAFSGNRIIMPENTFLMIHLPKAGVFGESSYLRSVADWLEKITDIISDIYAKDSKLSKEEILELMESETWFTAKEALEVFGDKVEVVDATEVKAVASLKTAYKTAPETLVDTVKPVDTTESDATLVDNTEEYKKKIVESLMEAYKL